MPKLPRPAELRQTKSILRRGQTSIVEELGPESPPARGLKQEGDGPPSKKIAFCTPVVHEVESYKAYNREENCLLRCLRALFRV